jgi:hypothetical protein
VTKDEFIDVDGYWRVRAALGAVLNEPFDDKPQYKVLRYYKADRSIEVIKYGVTKEEAIMHCRDPETSSSTAKSAAARLRTLTKGDWFDGWTSIEERVADNWEEWLRGQGWNGETIGGTGWLHQHAPRERT